jgi:Homeodomain
MKEQLVEMTGLSPRVIRVWFQNKRCKHNKKANQLKMQMEQEKVSFTAILHDTRTLILHIKKSTKNKKK